MPRRCRELIEGGTYHVYCRATRREAVFAEEVCAARLVETIKSVKKRDGMTCYAWAVMPTHYHIVVRTGEVPLWRSMRLIQGRFAQWFNKQAGLVGPVWQGRYKSKLVDEQGYLDQVVGYVHLNPVRAGLVSEPGRYRWSGHREIVRRRSAPLVDVDDVLVRFGDDRRAALASYRKTMAAVAGGQWVDEAPGRLPWWTRLRRKEVLQPQVGRPYVDVLGRSTGLERPVLTTEEYLRSAGECLGIDLAELTSACRRRSVVRCRDLVAVVGAERYGLSVRGLASALARSGDQISRCIGRAGHRRIADKDFAAQIETLDSALAESARNEYCH